MCISCHGNVFTKPFPSSSRLFLLIKNLWPSRECCFIVCFEVATQQGLYMLQHESKTLLHLYSVAVKRISHLLY
jgi:hypothetical protein